MFLQDLAVKTIEELWFSDFADRAHSVELKSQSPTTNASVTSPLERKTAVIMTVASHFGDRHSALEVFLDQVRLSLFQLPFAEYALICMTSHVHRLSAAMLLTPSSRRASFSTSRMSASH